MIRVAAWPFLAILVLVAGGPRALATQVPPLPAGNLLTNPWFRSAADNTKPGMDGWTVTAGHWTATIKNHNPTPDNIQLRGATYVGTAADLEGQKISVNVDTGFFQVVAADDTKKTLQFSTYWVTLMMSKLTITVYGGNTANGPWTKVWVPFDQTNVHTKTWAHFDTVSTTLAQGYKFYKVEVYGKTQPGGGAAKLTGMFLAASGAAAPARAPAPPAKPSSRKTTEKLTVAKAPERPRTDGSARATRSPMLPSWQRATGGGGPRP